MKNFIFAAITLFLLTPVSSYALFINGGFESGGWDGWTIEYGSVSSAPTYSPDWSSTRADQPAPQIISASSSLDIGQTLDVNPYNGNYMAKINDITGNYHATRISQTDSIGIDDIGDTLYVNWGAMLVNPSNHPDVDQPYFSIQIFQNDTLLDSFAANGNQAATDPSWMVAGSQYSDPLYYRSGQYTFELGSDLFSVGDSIMIQMFVTDCGYGAHGGFAFLDGIGTDYVAPPGGGTAPVPEPTTMLLFCSGLAGLVGATRKKFQR